MGSYIKVIFLLFILFTQVDANKKVTLQLSWLHQFQFAGYYMAKEKGFYKDVGLDVDIKEFKYGLELSSTIENNEADFAIGRSSLIIDKYKGKDIVALAAIYQKSPLMLLVTKKSGIKNIEDLKNKKIMITSDAKASASIIAMLNSNGIKIEDITIQKHSFNIEDLIEGKTDAMASYISNEALILANRDIEHIVFHPQSYGYKFYEDILFSSSKFIKNNPKLTKDFFDATIKGWKYAFDNIGETAEVIFYNYNSQNKSKIEYVREAEVLKELIYDEEDNKIGCLDKESLEDIVQVYKLLGLMKGDIDLDKFVYEHNPHKNYKFNLNDEEVLLIILLMTFIVFAIVLSIIYTSIKGKFLVTNEQLKEQIKVVKSELEQKNKYIQYQYNKLDKIINIVDEVIVFKDENLNYIECNDYTAKLFGMSKEEIIGKNDYYVFDKKTADFVTKNDKEVIRSNKLKIQKNWVKFPSMQKEGLFQSYLYPYEYEEGKCGIVIFARLVTKEYELEKEKLKSQKVLLEHSKIISISKLLRNISHQWKQPLSVVAMGLQNIQLSFELDENIDKDKVLEDVKVSLKHLKYMSNIIDDFSAYMENESIENIDINTKKIFEQLYNISMNDIEKQNIKLIEDIQSIDINISVNLIVQALINIYKNSLDVFESNEINQNDRYIFVTLKQKDENIVIEIKDSGDGIKEEMLSHLFEPYTTTKHQYIGVGLSLYITYHIIVDQMGGNITAKNVEYDYNNKKLKGALFTITLPNY